MLFEVKVRDKQLFSIELGASNDKNTNTNLQLVGLHNQTSVLQADVHDLHAYILTLQAENKGLADSVKELLKLLKEE